VKRLRSVAHHPARRHVLALSTLSAVSALGTVGSPFLVDAPLVLVGLSPRLAFLTIAARHAPLLPFLAVGTLRLALADPVHYDLGRRYGDAAFTRLPRRVEAWVRRTGQWQRPVCAAAVLLRPNGMYLTWAGAQGLSGRVVVALDVTGTLVFLVALHTGVGALPWG
jgi:hypothetical protein